MSRSDLKNLADQLVKRLGDEGFTIQRYDAYSTNSVYLKLDYGVCNSIRISDHRGKKHLAYRYNLVKGIQKSYTSQGNGGYPMYFVPASRIEDLIVRILHDRESKVKYRGVDQYLELMRQYEFQHRGEKGFWRQSRIVCQPAAETVREKLGRMPRSGVEQDFADVDFD